MNHLLSIDMQIGAKRLAEFTILYQEHFEAKLTQEEALEAAHALMGLVGAVERHFSRKNENVWTPTTN
jgi:hypothetical protein